MPTTTNHSYEESFGDALERVFEEYDELPHGYADTFTVWEEVEELNGHYGALGPSLYLDSHQNLLFGTEGLVYDPTCSNRVSQ